MTYVAFKTKTPTHLTVCHVADRSIVLILAAVSVLASLFAHIHLIILDQDMHRSQAHHCGMLGGCGCGIKAVSTLVNLGHAGSINISQQKAGKQC